VDERQLMGLKDSLISESAVTFTEEEIRPERMMKDKERFLKEDIDFLRANESRWVFVKCPVCESEKSDKYGNKHNFQYVKCINCKTVFTNPRPSKELLEAFYASSKNYSYWNKHIFPATESVRREKIFKPRVEKVLKYCRKYQIVNGDILEVGAGFGIFCEEIRKSSLFRNITALEPTLELSETCRKKGFNVINSTLEKVHECKITDIIVAFEVIEHVFSPLEFLSQCYRLLRHNGMLFLTCPNIKGFDIGILGILSNTFDHEHINYFNKDSIHIIIKKAGFKVLDIETPGHLDADIVRKHILRGTIDLSNQAFLNEVLIERWDEVGQKFQNFLANNRLSSHMWIIAQKN
jgi:2-polyprenyl-3-methyl-5-hydroxy-6-metoxy-1,4-benzoquinol methylase